MPDTHLHAFAGHVLPARTTEIRALTGIRGAASLFVVAYHLDLGQRDVGPLQHILHHGYLAVDLFFVLSGFVLALTSRALVRGAVSGANVRDFVARRIARIYPLYVFTLLIYLVEQGFSIGQPLLAASYWRDLLANVFLLQAWGIAPSISGAAWSISTEWFAYLLFPALVWLALRGGTRRALAVGLACVAIVATISLLPRTGGLHGAVSTEGPLDYADPTSFGPLLRCLTEFTLGLLTFRVARSQAFSDLLHAPAFGLAVMVTALCLVAIPDADLAFVLVLPLVVLVLATDSGPATWVFRTPLLHRLGVLSYGIYLIHPLLIWPWMDQLRLMLEAAHIPMVRAIIIFLTFSLSILLAAATCTLIERPMRQRLTRGKRQPPILLG